MTIPAGEVREAAVLPRGALRGARRANGVALGSARYGRYRSPALGAFTLYAWRSGPYVLLEKTTGERVVLTPDDAERFVEAIRAASSGR